MHLFEGCSHSDPMIQDHFETTLESNLTIAPFSPHSSMQQHVIRLSGAFWDLDLRDPEVTSIEDFVQACVFSEKQQIVPVPNIPKAKMTHPVYNLSLKHPAEVLNASFQRRPARPEEK